MAEIRMSLQDAATLLGIAPNSVRSRYKAGKVRGERDNQGKIWVWLDPELEASKEPSIEPSSKPSIEGSKDGQIKALEAHIQTLSQDLIAARAQVSELQTKAARADRFEAEIEGAKKLLALREEMLEKSDTQRDQYREEAKQTLQRLIELTERLEAREKLSGGLLARLFGSRRA